MKYEELAQLIPTGLIETGVEGAFDALSCSTAGDYPSMGCSQWEGIEGRGDNLLLMIPGGDHYIGRTYSDIIDAGEEESLKELLGSPEGQAAQMQLLASDAADLYVPALMEIPGLQDVRCMLYAAIWCPTSHETVKVFLKNRVAWGYNINNLQIIKDLFFEQYATAAGCEDYSEGYQNRANTTYNYCASLDLSAYGIPPYSC